MTPYDFAIETQHCRVLLVIKNWIIGKLNSRDLIGLVSMGYEPLYHAREIAAIKLFSGCSCKVKSAISSSLF